MPADIEIDSARRIAAPRAGIRKRKHLEMSSQPTMKLISGGAAVVPQSGGEDPPAGAAPNEESTGILEASLEYVAADLEDLMRTAPAGKRGQLLALVNLVRALARS